VNVVIGNIAIDVAEDYSKNEAGVYIAGNGIIAKRLCADSYLLPTAKLVRLIHGAATTKLTPTPMPANKDMVTDRVIREHSDIVQKQLEGMPKPHGIISGGFKDVIVSNEINGANLVIYGWFMPNGKPIQPKNATSHSIGYLDYSQSIRLISRACLVDGMPYDLLDVYKHPQLTLLVSDELLRIYGY
jgi:hypothetical protein